MRKNFPYVGAVYLLLIKDNKILLQRRFQTGYCDGNYGIPSGHLDGGESAKEGCVREVKEEIGITIQAENLEVVHVLHHKTERDERFELFLTVSSYEGEITNCEPNKCDDLAWYDLDGLPENMVGPVKWVIEQYKKGVPYSELGWRE